MLGGLGPQTRPHRHFSCLPPLSTDSPRTQVQGQAAWTPGLPRDAALGAGLSATSPRMGRVAGPSQLCPPHGTLLPASVSSQVCPQRNPPARPAAVWELSKAPVPAVPAALRSGLTVLGSSPGSVCSPVPAVGALPVPLIGKECLLIVCSIRFTSTGFFG